MDGVIKRWYITIMNGVLLFFAFGTSPWSDSGQWDIMGITGNAVLIILTACGIMIFVNVIYLLINIKTWQTRKILSYRFNYFVVAVIIVSIMRLLYVCLYLI